MLQPKKKTVKPTKTAEKYVPTARQKKNIEDAKQMKNMRPVFKSGGSLGMKSVKAGYDKNPGVTRADIITAAKGKAKSGTTMRKAQGGANMLLPGVYPPKSRDEKYKSYPSVKTKAKPKPKSTLTEATPQEVKKYGLMSGQSMKSGGSFKKKTGMDAVKAVGKYVSTFGGATERDNPKQKDINIVKKLKETGTKVKNKLGLKSGGTVKKCRYGCK